MMGQFAFLGHFGHLAMVMVPIGLVIAGLNLGALAHQIGDLFPLKWVPDTSGALPDPDQYSISAGRCPPPIPCCGSSLHFNYSCLDPGVSSRLISSKAGSLGIGP
ncbi:hypothetical protein DSO57_1034458 [Entomophthora muscae]|uniref:Uncharacterized protein n=1 Tax=Entomophthora muscae TaxID=34485 RepID=A0ACC2TAS2_9FUNG|nr:hypothetical protein DSO57_1034458 [Entomophthora muscae]